MREIAGRIMRLVFGLGAHRGQPFEEIFKNHVANSLECAKELVALCIAADKSGMEVHSERILELEHANDVLTKLARDQVRDTYITRLEAEDITEFIGVLERITNGMRTVAKKIGIFHIMVIRAEIQPFTELIRDATQTLSIAISKMPKLSRNEARAAESRVHQLEKVADHLVRDATARLWADEDDMKALMAWYVILQHLEDISNNCHHAAEILDAITLKMSY